MLTAAVTFGSIVPGHAQEEVLEQVITVATRSEIDAANGPGAISVLDRQELEFISHVHIQQSLLRVPGVNLHRGNGQEYLPAIRSPVLTGAGACGSFLTTEDNIPLRAAGFCNVNEMFDTHSEQAERIEVLRGPGTAMHGSNAMTGVVNVTLPTSPRKLVAVEAGPHDYVRLRLAGGGGADENQFGAYLTVTHDGGYRDDSGYDQYKLSLRHSYVNGKTRVLSGLTAAVLDQETAGFIEGKDAYLDESLSKENLNPEAFRESAAIRAWARVERSFSDTLVGVATPYVRYTDMDFLQHFLPGDPLEQNKQQSIGVQSSLHSTGRDGIELIAGLDVEFTHGELTQSQDTATPGSAFLRMTVPAGKHYDYSVDAATIAPFVQLAWTIADRWELFAGLRYEYTNYDYDNRMIDGRTRDDGTACGFGGCRYSRPGDRSDSFGNFSPKLELHYNYNQDHLAYLNLSTGFRAPQATELYRLQREQLVANLDSESVRSIELGFKGNRDSIGYDLALYAMEKEDVIFRDSDFFNVDSGATDHAGIELALTWDISTQLYLGLTANYARHEYSNDQVSNGININGNEIDTAPRRFGNLRLGWTPTPATRVELEWIHMDSYYLEPENLREYPGHDVVNLRVGFEFGDGWRASARVMNLADERYAERADFTTFSQERYFPGEPRSLFLGIEKHFD